MACKAAAMVTNARGVKFKCYAGRVKVQTSCVVFFLINSISEKIGDMRASNLFGNFTPLKCL